MSEDKRTFSREKKFAQKVANIFLDDFEVRVGKGKYNIAYCSVPNKRIWFDFKKVFEGIDQSKEMMNFKGYAFHEILHLKFTTRIARADRYRLNDKTFDGLIQRMEDGRIETMGVLRYQKVADFLIHAVNSHVIKDRDKIMKNKNHELINVYILLYGRSIYLPDRQFTAKIRELVIKTYGKDVADRLEKDIDEYILEILPSKRLNIALDLYRFLQQKKIFPDFKKDMEGNDIFEEGDDLKRLPKDMKELEKKFPQLKAMREKIRQEIEKKTPKFNEEEIEKARQENQAKKEQAKKDLKKEIEDNEKKWEDLDEEWDNASEEDQKKVSKKITNLEKEIKTLEQELEELDEDQNQNVSKEDNQELGEMIDDRELENQGLQEENEEELSRNLRDIGQTVEPKYSDKTFDIDGDWVRNSQRISKGLKKLNTELRQGYINKQKAGRLNVRQYINRRNVSDTKIFRKWLPDQVKKTKMLINIFVDGSGSMRGVKWEKTLGALWIINEAFNKDDNKIMVYEFSTRYALIKNYDQTLTRPDLLGNYTYILRPLQDALPRIEKYQQANGFKNVINLVITDGYFQDNREEIKVVIEDMNKRNHHTILMNVARKPSDNDFDYKFRHKVYVENFDDLTPKLIQIFGKIKKSLVKQVRI